MGSLDIHVLEISTLEEIETKMLRYRHGRICIWHLNDWQPEAVVNDVELLIIT